MHEHAIALGLERVSRVWQRMGQAGWRAPVITLAGTNGKGSCAAMLEACYAAGGYQTACYTSPHLERYTERVRVNDREVDEDALCEAFARVEQARDATPLTYFEFGTLAALDIFQRAAPDIVLLEVGLGGRLDAVNMVDADVALITSIGLDHQDLLGPDRESIGREKAGILRSRRPAVCNERDLPDSVSAYARALEAQCYRLGVDFDHRPEAGGWSWHAADNVISGLPPPRLRGAAQLDNAAGVVMVMHLLRARLPLSVQAIRDGLLSAFRPGRFQVIPAGDVEWILDVAHNPAAARELRVNLDAHHCQGRTFAVLGMLSDKDVAGVARALDPVVDGWWAAGLERASTRGLSAAALTARLQDAQLRAPVHTVEEMASACAAAAAQAQAGDRIVVFGSFYSVAEALRGCV